MKSRSGCGLAFCLHLFCSNRDQISRVEVPGGDVDPSYLQKVMLAKKEQKLGLQLTPTIATL